MNLNTLTDWLVSVPHDDAPSCGCVNICISDPDWLILVPSVSDVLFLFAVLHRGSDWINPLYEISTPPCGASEIWCFPPFSLPISVNLFEIILFSSRWALTNWIFSISFVGAGVLITLHASSKFSMTLTTNCSSYFDVGDASNLGLLDK